MDVSAYLEGLFTNPTTGGVMAEDAYGNNVAAAAAQAGLQAGRDGMGLMSDYRSQYQPYDQKFMSYVDNMGTDAYRAQQRGLSMTSVQQQSDAQNQAMNRQMAAMGVDPNSARFMATRGALAQQTALAKVAAAAGTDRNSRDEWAKGLGAINAMGVKSAELGLKSMDAAANYGKLGLLGADLGNQAQDRRTNAGAAATSAGAAATSAGAAVTNAGTNAMNAANNYQLGLGRLAFDRYSFDKNENYLREMGSAGNVVKNKALEIGTNWVLNKGVPMLVDYVRGEGSDTGSNTGSNTGSDFDGSNIIYT